MGAALPQGSGGSGGEQCTGAPPCTSLHLPAPLCPGSNTTRLKQLMEEVETLKAERQVSCRSDQPGVVGGAL